MPGDERFGIAVVNGPHHAEDGVRRQTPRTATMHVVGPFFTNRFAGQLVEKVPVLGQYLSIRQHRII